MKVTKPTGAVERGVAIGVAKVWVQIRISRQNNPNSVTITTFRSINQLRLRRRHLRTFVIMYIWSPVMVANGSKSFSSAHTILSKRVCRRMDVQFLSPIETSSVKIQ
jgi:hypothetical protein